MTNDVSDRDDRSQVQPGQGAAVERVIARHFEDDQIDAPTITLGREHQDRTDVATDEADRGQSVTAPRAPTARNFPEGARRFPWLFTDDATRPDENEGPQPG